MKHVFIITTFIVLSVSFAFGQNIDLKTFEKYMKSRLDRHSTESNQDGNLLRQASLFQQIRDISDNSLLKSTQNIKQKLDSLITEEYDEGLGRWVNASKTEYTYNGIGNNTLLIRSVWNMVASNWTLSNKWETSYDANGNFIQDVSSEWDTGISKWIPGYKYEWNYDANRKYIQYTSSKWDAVSSKWTPISKSENTYDAQEYLILITNTEWNILSSKWIPSYKYESTYDTNGNEIMPIVSEWEIVTSSWKATNKYERTYDTKGNGIMTIASEWEIGTSSWKATNKYETNFDGNGNIIQYINSVWDLNKNLWVINFKNEFTYDSNENIIKKYIYDRTDVNYNADEEIEFTYDTYGNLIKEIHRIVTYDSKGNTEDWKIPEYKVETIYDNFYTSDQFIIPSDFIFPWYVATEIYPEKHMINSYITYHSPSQMSSDDIEDSIWVFDVRGKLYYSSLNITGINEITHGEIKIYPNPASDFILIDLDGNTLSILIELFDLQGRKLLSKRIGSNEKLNMAGFKSGMYLYKLNMDGNIQSGKLVKE